MKRVFVACYRMALCGTLIMFVSCTTSPVGSVAGAGSVVNAAGTHGSMTSASASTDAATSTSSLRSTPPTRLEPQPEGTPLPPRDPTIADAWPPEIKQLIDNMITLFLKSTADSAPDIEEVQRRFGITLTEERLSASQQKDWGKRYTVDGTRYGESTGSILFRSFYAISSPLDSSSRRNQKLQLRIDPKLSGFCLSPYELAVYTGWDFSSFVSSPHSNAGYRPPAYAWGMFGSTNAGVYGGPGYYITVNQVRNSSGTGVDSDCVYLITVTGLYPKEI